jgi:membrane-associated phospholipid phosphatase
MSITSGTKHAAAEPSPSWPIWFRANVASWFTMLVRRPRVEAAAKLAWRAPLRFGLAAFMVMALVTATMIGFDAWAIAATQRLPRWLIAVFDEVTDFGKSGWFLVPTGVALLAMAAFASPRLPRMSRLALAALSVRCGFAFLAIALPGLTVAVVKRLVGRARPLVGGNEDPFVYLSLGWDNEYASLPSGHATAAFAAATAIGALWPGLRPLMWSYAIVIAASRVVLTAHHPSDVIAGAVVGVVGALLVRDWFAARRLGFIVAADGSVRKLPGPSLRRIKKLAVSLRRA